MRELTSVVLEMDRQGKHQVGRSSGYAQQIVDVPPMWEV
jgi:hypothetical protein